MKIIIFGASGSGTTTLAKAITKRLDWTHLDADEYYWESTQPPFQIKTPKEIRNKKLQADFNNSNKAIISGSLVSWGEYWHSAFNLGVFLIIPKKIRMERLLNREREIYGNELNTNKAIQAKSKAFLEWAEQYDDPTFEGRSIRKHQKWVKSLTCEVIKIEGDTTVEQRVNSVIDQIKRLQR